MKNIAFLMDKQGRWSLAPAFDVTYSYNPSGSWTATHQMLLNGKRDGFTLEDFEACAKSALMKRGRAATIVAEVQAAVKRWPEFVLAQQVDDAALRAGQRDRAVRRPALGRAGHAPRGTAVRRRRSIRARAKWWRHAP